MRRAEELRPGLAEQRSDVLLWVAFFLGPLAMGINTIVGYSVAHWVCDVNHKRLSFLVSAIDLLLCVVAFVIAFASYRQQSPPDESVPAGGRRFFMAKLAMLMSVLSALLVIAGTLAVVTLHPCD